MARRGIDENVLQRVLGAPGQRWTIHPGRDLLQSRTCFEGNDDLVRVFVDVDRTPAEAVTVFRTSNIVKYWRIGP